MRHTWRRPCKFGRLSGQICTAKRLKMLKNYQEKFRERFLLVLLYKTNQKHELRHAWQRAAQFRRSSDRICAAKRLKMLQGKNRERFLLILPYKTNRTQQLRHTWRWTQQRAGLGQRPTGPTFTEAAHRRNPGTPQDLRSQNQPAGQSVPPGHHPWVVGPNPGT